MIRCLAEPFPFRKDQAVPGFDDRQPVAVMDTECALCNWRAVVESLRRAVFPGRIAPAQAIVINESGLNTVLMG